jgi:putative PIG3 family NAD(P)H quinone oxidoreductase
LPLVRAVVISEPGGPDVLRVEDVPAPEPASGEVLLDVAASAVNRPDLLQRRGHYPPPPGAPSYPGLECSGTIAVVGTGVTGWTVGQRVCALLGGGGYAEQVTAPAGQLLPVPAGMSLLEAAALPEVTCTVWSLVFDRGRLLPGEVLLVHGGTSGVGTMAVQLAHRHGATIAVTARSPEKLAVCASLGAHILVNYREEDFVERVRALTSGHGADVILDNMGATYLGRNIEVLATNGRLVTIGLQGGRKAELDMGMLLAKRGAVIATTLRARPSTEKAAIIAAVREHVWPLIESGDVRPVIHSRRPLADAAAAHREMEASSHIGKMLLVT